MSAVSFRLAVAALALCAAPHIWARDSDDAVDVSAVINRAENGRNSSAPWPLVPSYPATRRMDLTEMRFGVPVRDPYRWLEGDPRGDADVQAWIEAENRATFAYLRSLPGRDSLRERMAELYAQERFSTPRKVGGRYFYTRNDGSQNFAPLYVRDGAEEAERLLVDPNALSAERTLALAEWVPSRDGRRLIAAMQQGGSDWRTLRIVDVDSGRVLPDRIEWVRYSSLSWNSDGTGFYYSRYDAPSGGDSSGAFQNQQIWFHVVGTDQTEDRLIYRTPRRPHLLHRAEVTADGRWLVISSNMGTDRRAELTLLSLTKADARPIPLVRGLTHEWQLLGQVGDRLYFRTDAGAPNGRLVALDASRPRRAPVDIIPQRRSILAGGSMIGSRLVLAYVVDGRVVAELAELDGTRLGDVPLPGLGAAAGFSGRPDDPETFYSFSSFTQPPTIYRYNVETGEKHIFAQSGLGIDPDDYVTEEIRYPSRDGTLVPMSIIRRRDLALSGRTAPTLLYGYGGFNVSQNPGFTPTRFAWVEQGGVLAIAGVRGGGEFGKAWHDAGRLANKQNGFDDFIAAAEYLKAKGYTGDDQLVIEGRSNGGLLVGAVVNQRPELFAAALPGVGVMDMLRFDQFTAGAFWVEDYGRPDREADFHNLRGYSPYHNIRPQADYPAILVTTADSDDRVVPSHSFKYAAALQAAQLGEKPRLIRIDTGAGHGSGKSIEKIIDEYADMYSFAAYWTGLTLGAKAAE